MKHYSKVLLCGLSALLPVGIAFAESPQQQKRTEILQAASKGEAGIPSLTAALKNPEVLIRRAAVLSLGKIGKPAIPALTSALSNDTDALTRRSAMRFLLKIDPANANHTLERGMTDPDSWVRSAAVEVLAGLKPYSEEAIVLLRKAQQDKDANVSQIASQALWPYHKEAVSLRERPEHKDHQLTVVQKILLPKEGWKFQIDVSQSGHLSEWFQRSFDDSKWESIAIEDHWENQGHANYDGVAWYRYSFELPTKPDIDGADLVFEGVDESAWVWVNGEYVGAHDIGPEGWNKQFAADANDSLKWGEKNQITVRVLDRAQGGGIWKPVYIEALKD